MKRTLYTVLFVLLPMFSTDAQQMPVAPRCNSKDCLVFAVNYGYCAEIFSPDFAVNPLNCTPPKRGRSSCVNVLSVRRVSRERGTRYTDPYLLVMMNRTQKKLDKCLSGWNRAFHLLPEEQSLQYTRDDIWIKLSLRPFDRDGNSYDRLTLDIPIPIPAKMISLDPNL